MGVCRDFRATLGTARYVHIRAITFCRSDRTVAYSYDASTTRICFHSRHVRIVILKLSLTATSTESVCGIKTQTHVFPINSRCRCGLTVGEATHFGGVVYLNVCGPLGPRLMGARKSFDVESRRPEVELCCANTHEAHWRRNHSDPPSCLSSIAAGENLKAGGKS